MFKEKGFAPIIILVGILVIVAVVGGVYYLGVHRSYAPVSTPNPEVTSTLQPSSVSQTTPTPDVTSTPNPTANWQTYTDTQNGFSIKYPTDWYTAKSTNSSNELVGAYFSPNNVPIPNQGMEVTLFPNKDGLTLSDYIVQNYIPKGNFKYVQTNLDNNPAIDLDGSLLAIPGVGSHGLFTIKNGVVYELDWHPTTLPNDDQLRQEMLSTFKFTQ